MTNKEFLKELCDKCDENSRLTDKANVGCPFRHISNDYCDEYNAIKKLIEKAEPKELTLKEAIKELKEGISMGYYDGKKLGYYRKHFEVIEKHLEMKELFKKVFADRVKSEVGKFVKGDTEITTEDILIIVDDKVHSIHRCFDQYIPYTKITLDDCMKIAKEKLEYTGYGILLVITESFLNGKIYRYGNYTDTEEWEVAGEMHGFA